MLVFLNKCLPKEFHKALVVNAVSSLRVHLKKRFSVLQVILNLTSTVHTYDILIHIKGKDHIKEDAVQGVNHHETTYFHLY